MGNLIKRARLNEKSYSFESVGLLDGFLDLPGANEILLKVFGYFSVRQLVGAKLVCRKFRYLIDENARSLPKLHAIFLHVGGALGDSVPTVRAYGRREYTFVSGNDVEPKTVAASLRHVQFDTGQQLFKVFTDCIYCVLSCLL